MNSAQRARMVALRHQTHYWHGCGGVIKFPLPGLLTYVHSKLWTIHTYLCIHVWHIHNCGGGTHYMALGYIHITFHWKSNFGLYIFYIPYLYIPPKSIQRGEETSQGDVPHGPSKMSTIALVAVVDKVPGTLLTVQAVGPMELCAFRGLDWWPIPKKQPQNTKT